MHSNVLPLPFVALLVYGAIQVLKSVVPGMDRWPNNVTRAVGYALTYAAIVVNARVGAPLHWADLWGLLPTAAAVYGGSALLYHVQDNAGPVPPAAPPPIVGDPQEQPPAWPGVPVAGPDVPAVPPVGPLPTFTNEEVRPGLVNTSGPGVP